MMNKNQVEAILTKISGMKILVIGDVMLDEYLWGKVNRISPEAPVPVVRVVNRTYNLGGAANVAQNLLSLQADVSIVGIIGDDSEGRILKDTLTERGVNTRGIIADRERATTLKTRVIAHDQQVVRIDHETTVNLSGPAERELMDFISSEIALSDAVIISDYCKGVIQQESMDHIIKQVQKRGIPCAIDPKIKNFPCYRNVSVITPNHHEASMALGMEINGIESLQKAGFELLRNTGCEMVLITWGKHGMGLFEQGNVFHHIETVSRKVYDVTGAGDTVIAVFSLAYAAGVTPFEAAELSNLAAGIVVSHVGTASVTGEELLNSFD